MHNSICLSLFLIANIWIILNSNNTRCELLDIDLNLNYQTWIQPQSRQYKL